MTWNRFVFVALPLALVLLAALAEGAAWALNGVAPRRHDLDRLVAALDGQAVGADIVFAGDSVTQDVLKSYRIGSTTIANLTTNQASGLIGTDFLLRRYLAGNPAPRHVVIASTPEFFAYDPQGVAARTYVSSVFRRAEEIEVLRRLGITESARWMPAALALEARVGEKLTGLFGARPAMPAAEAEAPDLPGEAGPVLPGVERQISQRANHALALSPSVRTALSDICALSAQAGFTLHLIRAPVPHSALAARGDADSVQGRALAEATTSCPDIRFADMNQSQSYPDHAFRDADHLRRPGWTSIYARQLAAYVRTLHDTATSNGS